MKLKSFNYLAGLLIIFLNSPLLSEDKIDIWKNKKEVTENTVTVRKLGSDKQEIMKREDLIKNMLASNKLPLN